MKQVRDHQERMGDFQRGRFGELHRQKLIERVELHELEAGGLEDLVTGYDGEGLVEDAKRAAVAVVVSNAEELVVFVEEAEIDAPGIDTDAGDLIRIEF